ncbi:methyltransferase domain-containing protein [Paenibacillus sp. GSMTC-2017]|uniref:class I SAM-dependent methyltransferase n=1 Tax=Paenibacillus sp. GSMTC-2017 TaxID=2794350 RepID=UPI0018D8DC8B|nr:class I SAM-dependent methyltransferase [Paenibacillus sp. GSMTC-2017]MBH5317218.1 methyltransferase domain-containing protein [Paenibacillus sp. GSMTC-2017]
MKPWYEQSFGSDYMIVYKHRDWENASREVRKMAEWLGLPQGATILDVGCGMGRHALALSEAGYGVTGLDLSEILLEEAIKHDPDGTVKWVQGDMREFPFPQHSFDATVNLFTSFGYFSVEDDNVQVLRNIRKVLKDGGSFLIDFLNPVYVEKNLVPRSQRQDAESGLTIVEVRSIVDGWVQKEITVSEPDYPERTRQYLERVRLFSLDWFDQHLAEVGLKLEQVYGNYDGATYDEAHSPRLIMVGTAQ